MSLICGAIDFFEEHSDFDSLKRMWKSMAPISRGHAYINKGISICCEGRCGAFCSLPVTRNCLSGNEGNCTLMLASPPPSPLLAYDMLNTYLKFGANALVCTYNALPFALVDEEECFVVLFSGESELYCIRKDKKIIFSSREDFLGAYFLGNPPISPILLRKGGIALFGDIKSST